MSKSKKTLSIFIDSNVLANWIIVSSALKIKGYISDKEKNSLLKELSIPIQKSYCLLEEIKEGNYSDIFFYSSNIAFTEVFSVISDEWRAKILQKKGVPIRYWNKLIHNIDLPDDYVKQITDEIDLFYSIFFGTGRFQWALDFNYNDVEYFIFNCKCNTQDAILLTAALMEKCKYFVTEDQRLRTIIKKKNFVKMSLITSDDCLRKFFNKK